ncbi:MAG: PKD domain-containing protein [Thermoplasmata archaeon]|nr:PKD domain-containing protein [Thermoplasmata archaeon]
MEKLVHRLPDAGRSLVTGPGGLDHGPWRSPPRSSAIVLAVSVVVLLLAPSVAVASGESAGAVPGTPRPPPVSPGPPPALGAHAPFWTNLTTGVTPPAGTLIVNDTADHYILGYRPNETNGPFQTQATWRFANGAWKNISTGAGEGPSSSEPGSQGVAMTYDAWDGYVVAVGGPQSTWEFHRGNWTRLTTTCAALCASFRFGQEVKLSYDAQLRATVLFDGGLDENPGGSVWTLAGTTWSPVCSGPPTNYSDCWETGTTPLRSGSGGDGEPAMTYDIRDGELVLFGGTSPTANGIPEPDCETWTLTNATWTLLNVSQRNHPPCRDHATLVDDRTKGYVLMFGGIYWDCQAFCFPSTLYALADTWLFALGKWWPVPTPNAPPRQGLASMAYDAAAPGVLCFQGDGNGGAPPPGRDNTTWIWSATPPPVGLQLIASLPTVTPGLPVTFHATFQGGTPPMAYAWSFGDGNHSTAAMPSEAFYAARNYTVSLTIRDSSNHSAFGKVRISVVPVQSGVLVIRPDPAEAGRPVAFSDRVSGGIPPIQVTWSFGDGTSANGPNVTHTFVKPGAYGVQVTLTGSDGNQQTSSVELAVAPSLLAPVIAMSPEPAAVGAPVYFSATVSGGIAPYRYAWDFGDGGMGGDQSTIAHTFASSAPVEVEVTVTDAVGVQNRGFAVHTSTLSVTASSNVSWGASPLTVGFNAAAGGGFPSYAYWWSFGDGTSSASPRSSHTYLAAGNYTAVLVVTDTRPGLVVVQQIITVLPGGGPLTVTLSASSSTAAIDSPVFFTASPSGGAGAYSLAWNAPSGCSSVGGAELECIPAHAGTLVVGVSVRDPFGHSNTVNASVVVGGNGTPSSGPRSPGAVSSASVPPWLTPFGEGALLCAAAVALGFLLVRRERGQGPPRR